MSNILLTPFDAIAIEEAIRTRERGMDVETVCVTIGPEDYLEQVRVALGMGVDRGILVQDEHLLDPYAVSRILRAVVVREKPTMVMMGKQAIDDDANQTGQMLAGLLGWPQATFVSKIEFLEGDTALQCTRETDAGLEILRMPLPAIITTDLRLNDPRYVSLVGLMRARKKPVEVLSVEDLSVKVQPKTVLLQTSPTSPHRGGIRVSSVEELITKLKGELKIL